MSYTFKDFGAGDAPTSRDLMDAMAFVQTDQAVELSFVLNVRCTDTGAPVMVVMAHASAPRDSRPMRLYAPLMGNWPNRRHRTVSALLYRMVLDLSEAVALEQLRVPATHVPVADTQS